MEISKKYGFTLIELLVVIGIIGFIATIAAVSLTAYRANGRDSSRTANIDTIVKALNLYITSSQNGYPASGGECLSNSTALGMALKNANVIKSIPLDPRWPTVTPASTSGTDPNYAVSGTGFCYYYSGNSTDFRISYYLETDTGALKKGINVKSPAK